MTSDGEVTDDGGGVILSSGIVASISPNPTIDDLLIDYGTETETYESTLRGLDPTTIYVHTPRIALEQDTVKS